jgi:hypothetical protein
MAASVDGYDVDALAAQPLTGVLPGVAGLTATMQHQHAGMH